ncbi:MAG TPA: arsenate reductase ArsC [Ilumatobacteraceae bacterium]|jgi:arsenate reductase (thioredoxin)|nr:arsenate reductase ArsC [Ilumatobacteraceae bacterium]
MNDDRVELTTEEIMLIRQGAERLRQQFEGTFNLETIERYMLDSQELLHSKAKFTKWLPLLVERFTRDRLRAVARLEFGSGGKPAVLFLCVHNAGRSQLGAGWLRHLAGDQVDVFSGGTDPGVELNDVAVAAMAEVGIDIGGQLPQPWSDEIVRAVDVIISMGCGDACPVYPGKRYEEWDLGSPSGQPIEVVREIRDDVRTRVEALIASLGLTATIPEPQR